MSRYTFILSLKGRKIVRNTLAENFAQALDSLNIKAQLKKGARVVRTERRSLKAGFDPIALILQA